MVTISGRQKLRFVNFYKSRHVSFTAPMRKYGAQNLAKLSETGQDLAESAHAGPRFPISKSRVYLVGSGAITTYHHASVHKTNITPWNLNVAGL